MARSNVRFCCSNSRRNSCSSVTFWAAIGTVCRPDRALGCMGNWLKVKFSDRARFRGNDSDLPGLSKELFGVRRLGLPFM